ncbi:putative heterokaryon incompatibility protein [Rosellinia necatrix]|uniref:Putative heterokaryon incompatibility protein n=1 Tax=Rosellinia necatrix TaxID=77044 RepID=A0A1S7UIB8_ROSNE|nr:putative heterokaryon incompatibility protein [Rosellinia necatrix]
MGIRYLWIDALCIVQDDEQAKAYEIERMGDIYNNATFVIIASGTCRSVKDGFLNHLRDIAVVPFLIQDATVASQDQKTTTLCLAPSSPRHYLDSRGWTFQERHLAVRSLEFTGSKGVIFTCAAMSLKFREGEGWGRNHLRSGMGVVKKGASWRDVVLNYSGRGLTFADDRLPALAGYASWHALDMMQARNTGDDSNTPTAGEPSQGLTYVAGMWSTHLIRDLLWLGNEVVPRNPIPLSRYRSPGWSWVSVLDHQPPSMGPISMFDDKAYTRSRSDAKVLSYNVQLAHPQAPFGRVTKGTITLEAKVAAIDSIEDEQVRMRMLAACNYVFTPEQLRQLHFVRLRSALELGDNTDYGLILIPMPDQGVQEGRGTPKVQTFMRMGMYRHLAFLNNNMPITDWDSVQAQVLQII